MTASYPLFGQHDEGLLACLADSSIADEGMAGVLEEFAVCSLLRGVRVREYCEELQHAIEGSKRARDPQVIHAALRSSTLPTLYPFFIVPPFSTPQHPLLPLSLAHPTSLLPPQLLPTIRRPQLVDSLVTLSRARTFLSQAKDVQASIAELCLEYVGRKWREAIEMGYASGAVEVIASKLGEVELELRFHGEIETVRTVILPVLRHVRFTLGLVPSFQLVSRLHTLSEQQRANHVSSARQLLTSWIVRRLNFGHDPAAIAIEVVSMTQRLSDDATKTIFHRVLDDFGLSGRSGIDETAYEELGVLTPPPSISSPTLKRNPFSFLGRKDRDRDKEKDTARRTIAAPTRWFSHSKSDSTWSISKLAPGTFNQDRRPSLPTISTPLLLTPAESSSPVSPASTPYLGLGLTRIPPTPASTLSPSSGTCSDYLASPASHHQYKMSRASVASRVTAISGASNLGQVRLILIDHLLGMRFRLLSESGAGWFLGDGKSLAQDLIDDIESKLARRHHPNDISTMFGELRSIFHLPVPVRATPALSPRKREASGDTVISRCAPTSPLTYSDRGVSFDLDQYIRDISHDIEHDGANAAEEQKDQARPLPARRRGSSGAASILSMTSRTSFDGRKDMRLGRLSTLSAFSIREAVKKYPLDAIAVQQGSAREASLAASSTTTETERKRSIHLASRSTPKLVDRYTSLPAPLRTTRRRDAPPALQSVPRHYLKARDSVPSLESCGSLDSPGSDCTSDPATPMPRETKGDRARRQWNRRCAIVDHIEVSPPKSPWSDAATVDTISDPSTPHQPDGNNLGFGLGMGAQLEAATVASASAPHVPARQSSLTNLPKLHPRSAVPFGRIISLFAQGQNSGQDMSEASDVFGPRCGISVTDVEAAVRELVDLEKQRTESVGGSWDVEAKSRVVWLLEQVEALVPDPALKYPVYRAMRALAVRPVPIPLQLRERRSGAGAVGALPSAGPAGTFGI